MYVLHKTYYIKYTDSFEYSFCFLETFFFLSLQNVSSMFANLNTSKEAHSTNLPFGEWLRWEVWRVPYCYSFTDNIVLRVEFKVTEYQFTMTDKCNPYKLKKVKILHKSIM